MVTIAPMAELDVIVPLQIAVRKRTRNRLRHAATDTDLSMSVLGDALLDYALAQLEAGGKLPAALAAAVEKATAAAEKARKDKSQDSDA